MRKALAYRPVDRYASAEELAHDLEAGAAGRPVSARPLGVGGRIHALWRHHRTAIGVAALLIATAMGALLASTSDRPEVTDDGRTLRAAEDLVALAWYDNPSSRGFERAIAGLRAIAPEHAWLTLLDGVERGSPGAADPHATAAHHLRERRWKEAFAVFDDAFDPSTADLLQIATLARAAGRARRSSDSLERLIREPPVIREHPLAETALFCALLGHRALGTADHDAAAAHFRRGATIQPTWTRFHLLVARARTAAGDDLADVSDGVWEEGGLDALGSWARYLDSQGKRAAARALFRRLLDKGADPVETTYRIASSFDRDHRIEDAETSYRDALAHDPEHVFSLFNLAWMYAGLCGNPRCPHPHMNRRDESRAMLLRALRADGGRSPEMAVHVPEVARVAGCEREVLEWIDERIAQDRHAPTVPRLRTMAAEIRRRMNR